MQQRTLNKTNTQTHRRTLNAPRSDTYSWQQTGWWQLKMTVHCTGCWEQDINRSVLVRYTTDQPYITFTGCTTTTTTTTPFNGLFSRTTWVSWYQKGKASLDLNEARGWGLGWQWHQLDHMQTICTSLQTGNDTNTSSPNFCRPDALPDAQPTVLED